MIDGFKFCPPGLPARLKEMNLVEHDDIPWAPLEKRIEDCKFALLTTAGISMKGEEPFDMERERKEPTWGDPSFRIIPRDAGQEEIEVNHLHINTRDIQKDLNCAFPLDRFKELEAEGKIGSLAGNNYSIMGYIPVPHTDILVKETAPAIARKMKEDGVDAAFLAPVWPLCNQSVGLVQRVIEEAGIPTISLSLLPFITRKVKVPRALAVEFPFAHPFGKPFDKDQQLSIINDAFKGLESFSEAGTIQDLPYQWSEEDTKKQDWWPEEHPPIVKFMMEQMAKKKTG